MKKRTFYNPVYKDKVRLLAASEDSKGEYTLLEIDVAPGGGNPLHAHLDYTEKFTVISGVLEVQVGRYTHLLHSGDSITVPRKDFHRFANSSEHLTKFLVELRPAQPGFEKAMAIAYGLAADGLVTKRGIPKKFAHLSLVVVLSNALPAGFARLMMPLFRWKATRSGAELSALVSKYC